MEPGVIAAVILIAFAGGGAAVLARQRPASWGLPMLRATVANIGDSEKLMTAEGSDALPDGRPGVALLHSSPRPVRRVANGSTERDGTALPEPVRLDLVPPWMSQLGERLDRIEDSLEALRREIERQQEQRASFWSDAQRRQELDEAKSAAALERLKAEVLAVAGNPRADRQSARSGRRAEVSADLYARLARLESALAAVTNPILLPGEPYSPPAELPTEALIWENWNEVGERAFALADAYSAQRLHLSANTSAEVGEFVTALRILLTRSVYPHLQGHPDTAQQAALHAALVKMAAEFPRMRETLVRTYGAEDDS